MRACTLALIALALALSGCGAGAPSATPAERRLQREDLVAVSRALQRSQSAVIAELIAAKAAWPYVANGLPAHAGERASASIAAAAASAVAIQMPALLQEAQVMSLTGPAASIGGLFRTYVNLAQRGWQLIAAALQDSERGPAASARFARENAALYIESVYDGHFDLAQIAKKLRTGYSKLGGPAAFGASLTHAEADALARVYSEARARLHPHVGVRLGS